MKDEYIRDFAFEPEFIYHKKSIEINNDRVDDTKQHQKSFSQKFHSIDEHKAHSERERKNSVDDEVDSFRTVNIMKAIPSMNHA